MPPRNLSPAAGRGEPIAVIDIGSNSGRVMVFQRDAAGCLRVLAGSRAPLRLVHDVDQRTRLTEKTMARTMEALRDFQAIANGSGARQIIAVATAAMRDANNGRQFVARVRRELNLRIDIIGGVAEAQFGFAGAVRGLAVSDGLLFDLGGGSMQLTRFARRRLNGAVSLPFGALRVTERFLQSDPPTRRQVKRLREHVRARVAKTVVTRLRDAERLVGTGGTVRNLAKIDRHAQPSPIGSLHAYELPVDRLGDIVDLLASTREKRRDSIPGLSAERADSIVGGAVVIHALAEHVRAKFILVSGQGVREGVALGRLRMPMAPAAAVKDASLESLASRFDSWRPATARRRRQIASALLRALEPRAPAAISAAVDAAARLLDIGRSLDLVNRHHHVADILLTTELSGITHQELTLAAAVVQRAGDRHAEVEPLLSVADAGAAKWLDRAAVIVALADELETRCPPNRPIEVRCSVGRSVTVTVRALPSWLAKDIDRRFERVFGRPLIVRHGAA
jgi:exopolyphosphatase/guanosine-5'-triphosphate,3'-diphosphate pyrophosphatase